MTITYRNSGDWDAGKGSKLTSLEADNNFWTLQQLIDDLNSTGGLVSWDSATISGNTLTFHKTDGTTSSVTIPTATPTWRGEFSATSYAVFDWFSESGTIYQVLVAHTGEEPFDSGRIISGNSVYQKILDFPAIPGFERTGTTFTPALSDANSWNVCSNAAGCLVTIDAAVAFAPWTELHFRDETKPGGGLTIEGTTGGADISVPEGYIASSACKGASMTLKKFGATDTWHLMGLLAVEPTA